jgi:Mrp family chromosome partitioning ATPase
MIKPASDNVAVRPRLRRPRRGTGDVAEYYRDVLRQLPWPGHEGSSPVRTLGVTSCVEGEGVSTLAVQMAAAAASYEGCRVLLVDANLARPSLHRMLRVSRSPGLAECLLEPTQPGLNLQPSPDGNFAVLAAGNADGHWQQAYDSPTLARIVQGLRDGFDLVVLDLPATGQTMSAAQLAGVLDGTLLVIEADCVSWEVARRTKELLSRAGVRLVGAVLNKRRDYLPAWLYRKL